MTVWWVLRLILAQARCERELSACEQEENVSLRNALPSPCVERPEP